MAETNNSSPNQALFDALVRHQIYLLRLGGSVRRKIDGILRATEQDMAEKIRDRLRNSQGLSTPADVRRMNTLLRVVRNIRTRAWSQVDEEWAAELTAIAETEPEILSNIVLTTSPVVVETILPAPRLLRGIVTARPFEGRTLREWSRSLAREDIRRIQNAIRVGMVQGEPSDVIARRVVGTARLRGRDGVTEITRRQADSITRTAINFVANEVRSEFLGENSDLFREEMFVATLDARTTAVCRGNDGKTFPVGKGPRPPLHWNCRSLRVPVFDGDSLGNRPARPVTNQQLLREFAGQRGVKAPATRAGLPRGMRGDFDEFSRRRIRQLTQQVPQATTYQTWLRGQSAQFQDDVLGKTKGRLFREGGLTLDRFVNRNGDELTLPELARLHADAFRAAGLDPAAFSS